MVFVGQNLGSCNIRARERKAGFEREREEALEPTEERCIEISEMMLKKNKGKQA
jgi:hypothetical protein